jgi:hypothetical protein
MTRSIVGASPARSNFMGMQSLKRISQPADVASVTAFLAPDDAHWKL